MRKIWIRTARPIFNPREKGQSYTHQLVAGEVNGGARIEMTRDAFGVHVRIPDGDEEDCHIIPWANIDQATNVPLAPEDTPVLELPDAPAARAPKGRNKARQSTPTTVEVSGASTHET